MAYVSCLIQSLRLKSCESLAGIIALGALVSAASKDPSTAVRTAAPPYPNRMPPPLRLLIDARRLSVGPSVRCAGGGPGVCRGGAQAGGGGGQAPGAAPRVR